MRTLVSGPRVRVLCDRRPTMRAVRSLRRLALWPFRSRFSSPVWLLLRFYLGWIWLQFGVSKLQGGWLTSNPLRGLLRAVGEGQLRVPIPLYQDLAALLVQLHADRVLSVIIPLAEIGIALAFFTGVALVPAAIAAIAMNVNLILFGIASIHYDGRIITMQLLLLLAWRVAGYLGLGTLLVRV